MSASSKRRRRAPAPEEHSDSERWLVSYADMLTVLVGLFIVLYAMSQVDQDKFEKLAASLAEGFGGPSQAVLHTGSSIMDSNSPIAPLVRPEDTSSLVTALRNNEAGAGETSTISTEPTRQDLEAARGEYENLQEVADTIETRLTKKGLAGSVTYRINERGLVLGLVSDELFFVADTAELTAMSRKVIDATAPVLTKLPNRVAVEGHANTLPSSAYASNWELSADRAVQVLRRYVGPGDFPAERISATGFGDTQPLASNETVEGLAANRRVDVVVLSDQPERIRELIAQIAVDAD
ncbi:OmpA/MotB family protein [Timonella senegalensis]|uniref:OmpA/MotB family protein n=1 Tax=Timonella senegalensis TaxID=1465825 RepID=UPI0002F6A000|nr:flagellar motor protein MotB [Timonella senegalensis]